jgi:subtilisin family serine protease
MHHPAVALVLSGALAGPARSTNTKVDTTRRTLHRQKPGRRRSLRAVGGLLCLATAAATLPAAADSPTAVPDGATAAASFANLPIADLWTLIEAGDNRAIVGLKDNDEVHGVVNGRVLLDDTERPEAMVALRAQRGVQVVSVGDVLPTVTVELDNIDALAALRSSDHVEYVEPARFYGRVHSDSGCTENAGNTNPYGGEPAAIPQTRVDPGDLVPDHFRHSRIPEAWGRNPAAGAGVSVAVIDTGRFITQTQLRPASIGGRFDVGMSSGRHYDELWEMGTSAEDICNHGTRSAGTIAAPRDGQNLVGVAYRANLVVAKVDNDVTVGPEVVDADRIARGITRALGTARSRAGVDNRVVISIAMGTPFSYSSIEDAINNAYAQGALIVAAAGTGPCELPGGTPIGVMFPARLGNVMAATALEANGQRNSDSCDGPEVDIAAVITGASAPGRTPQYILSWGGSSAATGIVAGTAALVWSQHPNWTRDDVWNRLVWARTTASGPVDAYKAVGGVYGGVRIAGPPAAAPDTTFTLTAEHTGEGPFAYQWSNGATSQTATFNAGAAGTSQTITVNVIDTVDGRVHQASVQIETVAESPRGPVCRNPRFC